MQSSDKLQQTFFSHDSEEGIHFLTELHETNGIAREPMKVTESLPQA